MTTGLASLSPLPIAPVPLSGVLLGKALRSEGPGEITLHFSVAYPELQRQLSIIQASKKLEQLEKPGEHVNCGSCGH